MLYPHPTQTLARFLKSTQIQTRYPFFKFKPNLNGLDIHIYPNPRVLLSSINNKQPPSSAFIHLQSPNWSPAASKSSISHHKEQCSFLASHIRTFPQERTHGNFKVELRIKNKRIFGGFLEIELRTNIFWSRQQIFCCSQVGTSLLEAGSPVLGPNYLILWRNIDHNSNYIIIEHKSSKSLRLDELISCFFFLWIICVYTTKALTNAYYMFVLKIGE